MIKIEPGKTYYHVSAFNSYWVFALKVVSRTEKTAVIIDTFGMQRRVKIRVDNEGGYEYIKPNRYAYSSYFRACDTEKPKIDCW